MTLLMPHHHLSHYHLLRLKDYPRLLWSQSLGTLGHSLVAIFIPIYLIKELEFSIQIVLLWYLVYVLVGFPLIYLGALATSRYGSKRMIAAGLALHALSIISIMLISPSRMWLVWLSAVLLAAYRGIYWPALHAYFSKIKKAANAGQQIGLTASVILLIQSLAPAIGGLIADTAGISIAYGMAVVLILLAIIPILSGSEVNVKRRFDLKLLHFKKIKDDLTANAAEASIVMVEALIWPLLIFFIVGSYGAIGLLSSVALFAAILTTLYVGKKEAARGEKHYLKQAVATLELSHVLRLIAVAPPGVFVVNAISGISTALRITPFITRYYTHADEEPRIEYIMAFEIAFQLGLLLVTVILLAASIFISHPGTLLLLGVAITMPLSLLILKIR